MKKILLFIVFCFNSLIPAHENLFFLFKAIEKRDCHRVEELIAKYPDILNAANMYSEDGENFFWGTPLAYAKLLSPFSEFLPDKETGDSRQKIIAVLEKKQASEEYEKMDMLEAPKTLISSKIKCR